MLSKDSNLFEQPLQTKVYQYDVYDVKPEKRLIF